MENIQDIESIESTDDSTGKEWTVTVRISSAEIKRRVKRALAEEDITLQEFSVRAFESHADTILLRAESRGRGHFAVRRVGEPA